MPQASRFQYTDIQAAVERKPSYRRVFHAEFT
jgi:hypothetical protein